MPADIFSGDSRGPKPKQYIKEINDALRKYLPEYTKFLGQGYLWGGKKYLDAQKNLAPQEMQLLTNLYKRFGPQLAGIQGDINDITQNRMLAGEGAALTGQGGQNYLNSAALAQAVDPEFYNTRAATGARLNELLANPITDSELESISRGLNRFSTSIGNNTVPSNIETVAAGLTFGGAARDRLTQAVNLAAGSLPNFKTSSIGEAFGIGSGGRRAAGYENQKETLNAFDPSGANPVAGLTGNLFGAKTNTANIDANRRTVYDAVNQSYTAAGSGTSGFAGGCCFIFLEAYNGKLPWYVREARDMFYQFDPDLAKGYKQMAAKLVPLMQKSEKARNLVNTLMIKPLTEYGAWMFGIKTRGYEYLPVVRYWFSIWKGLANYAK